MKYCYLTILLSTALYCSIYSQYASLYVQHPQTLRSGSGTVEDASVVMTQKGIFMQHELFLTFSGRGNGFLPQDSIEIQLSFSMPKEAIVTNLWLWVDGVISEALILDKWTASSIYESIVKRRKDPALLLKNSSTSYQLKIYPLRGDGTRKIKMTYLLPLEYSIKTSSCRIPLWMIQSSRYILPKFPVSIFTSSGTLNRPRILGRDDLFFSEITDSLQRQGFRYDVPSSLYSSISSVVFNTMHQNGVVFYRFSSKTENYFQLGFIPSIAMGIKESRKVAFVVDYESEKTTLSKENILSTLKSAIKDYFTPSDSFNVFMQNNQSMVASTKWIAGDSSSIQSFFQSLLSELPNTQSNLQVLLISALEFLKKGERGGQLVILAASDRFGDYRIANPIIQQVGSLLSPRISIHVADALNRNYNSYYINGKYYYGNDYLYENLVKLGKGVQQTIRNGLSLPTILLTVMQTLQGSMASFDLVTRLADGYCYGRISSTANMMQTQPVDNFIWQIGKYQGTSPFIVELSGMFLGTVVQRTMSIPETAVIAVDSTLGTAWSGKYIAALEALPATNDINRAIIDLSLQNRILSILTAFLALEPNDSVRIISSGSSVNPPPTGIVKDNAQRLSDTLLIAYPNPFNATTKIRIRLPGGVPAQECSAKIMNILGQSIRTFDISSFKENAFYTLTWDGRSEAGSTVTSGVYYFVLFTPKGSHSLKLLMIK